MWLCGGGCGCGFGMENPTPVQNVTYRYLEPDSIISSLFVQSVIFCQSVWSAKQIGGCGEVCVCGCEEV